MAAGNIRGITIEIGGDVTKLDKELSKINSQSNALKSELRDVNRLLKLDPTNTELLAQKQEILSKSIEETRGKLDILKEAERQVQQQFERGEVSEQQYRALQREIIATEQQLGELERAARETADATEAIANGGQNLGDIERAADSASAALEGMGESAQQSNEELEKMQQRADNFSEKMEGMGEAVKGAMVAAGAAAVSAGGYALKFDSDFDNALNSVISQTGAASSEIEGLEGTLKDIYNDNFGEDIEDVANSLAQVKQQTQETDPTKLKELTENALTLRDTFDMDVTESMRAVNQLMTQFGIDSETAFDLVVQGAQNGLNKNDNLLDTINEYSPKFQQMGLSAEDMFAMLKNGCDAGVFDIDKLGDAINEFSIRAKDGTADNAFKELGLDVERTKQAFGEGGEAAKQAMQDTITALSEIQDPLKQNQLGVEVFGTMWEDTGGSALLAMKDMGESLESAKGKMDDIKNTKYDDLGNQFAELGRNIQTELVKPIGEELEPTAKEVLGTIKDNLPQVKETLSGVISSVKEFISFVSEHGELIISIIGGIAAGMLAWNVVTMIQGLISTIKLWTQGTQGMAAAQAILNHTMLANPIALIVAGIVGLIAALVLLYNNCEGFRNAVNAIFESVKGFVSTVVEAVGGFISSIWDKIQEVWNFVQPYLLLAWASIQAIWSAVLPYFQGIWEGIKQIFSVVADVLGGFFSTAWTVIQSVWNVVTGYFQAIWDTIAGIFSVVQAVLSGDFQGAWDAIKGIFASWGSFFSGLWDNVVNIFSAVVGWFGDIFGGAWEAVKGVFASWGDFFAGLWDTICNTFSDLGTSIGDAIGGAVKTAINGVIGWIEDTINGGIRLINGAIGLINKVTGAGVGKMGYLDLPRLAKGGILHEGQAMVAEAGPELLQMVNGKAVVTPLTSTAKNNNIASLKGNVTNQITLHIDNFVNNREEDIRQLTERILEIADDIKESGDRAFA